MTLKYAAERMTGQAVEVNTGALSEQLTKYASILAAQGALSAALTYLGQSNEVRKILFEQISFNKIFFKLFLHVSKSHFFPI